MNQITDWAVQQTLNNGWKKHRFHQFLKNSTQQEFLTSQIPFFYAVQGFPRALAKLASLIETNEHRLLVVENLSEEHGHGNIKLFHTESFKTFLYSVGWNGKLHKNPWIEEWIDTILSTKLTASEFSAYLSGIEYAYAPISQDISEHLTSFDLTCEQSHYSTHAELDWEHGRELLEVAYLIGSNEDAIKTAFNRGQSHFLELYEHILIPTLKEIEVIHQEPISFYYTREDSTIELAVLNKIIEQTSERCPNILMIASGGEHLFNYISKETPLCIDVVDMNSHQIKLCQDKLSDILQNNKFSNSENHYSGKFEKTFLLLREYMGRRAISDLCSSRNRLGKQKLKFVMDILFSNQHLSVIFDENATQFTKKNFSKHFYNVFMTALYDKDSICFDNIHNIINGDDIRFNTYTAELIRQNINKHIINWHNSSFDTVKLSKKYDIINISNIGDWMPLLDFKQLLINLKEKLHPDGHIIVRKLLGDYNLSDELKLSGYKTEIFNDLTYFYTETVVGINCEN